MIFPLLLPLLSFLGTSLMNSQGNNTMLLIMLALIPLYLIFLIIWRNKVAEVTFPVAILMISLALVIMHSLTSNHIMGRDINTEYYVFQTALENHHWTPDQPTTAYNACLSVTTLPVAFQTILNINGIRSLTNYSLDHIFCCMHIVLKMIK